MIVCNLHRFLQFLLVKVFYRAKKRLKIRHHTELVDLFLLQFV
jgi:hypothetical protein